ncbi:aspartic peptidase domain-containing protein [Phascolomyces articulosus]|uniref:Mucorpepsin n=1 Tax=Phascolomyces articulosus TaxID=60185 RepID=A0AAD5KRN0_9FUNG|nr:aspartic peptidase domain-containing protein [Phascolomyces articulosus]
MSAYMLEEDRSRERQVLRTCVHFKRLCKDNCAIIRGSRYLVQVGIGSPLQNFTVTLDTGSAALWVPSTDCPSSQCPYDRFDSSKSSSFNASTESFGIVYGIGSVNGTYVTDTVNVVGVAVQNKQIGLATSTADILTNPTTLGRSETYIPSPTDNSTQSQEPIGNGILGLGYPKLTVASSQGEPVYNPFVFNLMDKKLIQQPIFSVYMNNADEEGWVGEVIFGGTDNTKYTGEIAYLPVAQIQTSGNPLDSVLGSSNDAYYYWMVYGQGVAIGNSQSSTVSNMTFESATPFIIDTGTTLTYLPDNVAIQVAEGLVGQGNYQLDRQSQVFMATCSAADKGATLQLQMSSSDKVSSIPVTLTVPVSELLIPYDGPTVDTATTCILGIAPLGSSSDMVLIGDSVLRSSYLVFDMGENRIGFAAANSVPGSVNGVGSPFPVVLPTDTLPMLLHSTVALSEDKDTKSYKYRL